MSERKMGRRGGCGWLVVVAFGLALLPVLYVLSLGPYNWLVYNHYIQPGYEGAEFFYGPIFVVSRQWPAFHKFLVWYMLLFEF